MSQPDAADVDTLTASVRALGLAACEYRFAVQAASVAAWRVEPSQRVTAPGMACVEGRQVLPHLRAIRRLEGVYTELRRQTGSLYETAALAYAYGTASALRAVLAHDVPAHVELSRRSRLWVVPDNCLPDLRDALTDWNSNDQLTTRRQRVIDLEGAAAETRAYASFEDLADCNAPEIRETTLRAAGLGDSAFAYGETAERALHFVLLNLRADDSAADDDAENGR